MIKVEMAINSIETELRNIKAQADPEHFNKQHIDIETSYILEQLSDLKNSIDTAHPENDPFNNSFNKAEKQERAIRHAYESIANIYLMMKQKLNPETINSEVLNSILEKTDNIITDTSDLKVKKGSYNIAYTERRTKTIYLNHKEIIEQSETEQEYLILTKALNYHELAHNIYTAYDPQDIRNFLNQHYYINQNLFRELLNLFEDTRIETLFYTAYPKLKDYFTYTAGKLILNPLIETLKDPQKQADENDLFRYISLYGRKFLYLNKKHNASLNSIRATIKARYPNIKEYETLLNEFNTETETSKHLETIKKVYDLIIKDQKGRPRPKGDGDQKGDDQENEKQTGTGTGNSTETQESTDKQDSDQETDGETETDINQDIDKKINTDPSNNKNIFRDDQNLSRPRESKKDQKEREEKEKELIEKIKDLIKKQETQETQEQTPQEMTQDLNTLKEISSEDIKEEIKKDLSRIINIKNDELGFYLTNEHHAERKRIEDIIKVLRADLNFRVIRQQKRGKFDIKSYIKTTTRNSDPTRIYQNTIKNKVDKSKMLISLCIDKSGSMSGDKIKTATETAYIFSTALENLKNKVEVLTFSNGNETIKDFNTKGNFKIYANGDTFLYDTLRQAQEDLNQAEKTESIKNKFCFVISDGGFSDRVDTYNQLRRMKESNIKTIWILISDHARNNRTLLKNYNGFDYFIEIENFKQLGEELKKLIEEFQKDINNNLLMN